MDIGTNFLEKLEETYGRTVFKVVLFIVAMGICAVSVSLVVTHILTPIYSLIASAFDGDQILEARKLLNAIGTIFFFVWAMHYVVTAYQRRLEIRQVEQVADRYQEYADYVSEFYSTADKCLDKIARTRDLLEPRLSKGNKTAIREILNEMTSEIYHAKMDLAVHVQKLNDVVTKRKTTEELNEQKGTMNLDTKENTQPE